MGSQRRARARKKTGPREGAPPPPPPPLPPPVLPDDVGFFTMKRKQQQAIRGATPMRMRSTSQPPSTTPPPDTTSVLTSGGSEGEDIDERVPLRQRREEPPTHRVWCERDIFTRIARVCAPSKRESRTTAIGLSSSPWRPHRVGRSRTRGASSRAAARASASRASRNFSSSVRACSSRRAASRSSPQWPPSSLQSMAPLGCTSSLQT